MKRIKRRDIDVVFTTLFVNAFILLRNHSVQGRSSCRCGIVQVNWAQNDKEIERSNKVKLLQLIIWTKIYGDIIIYLCIILNFQIQTMNNFKLNGFSNILMKLLTLNHFTFITK